MFVRNGANPFAPFPINDGKILAIMKWEKHTNTFKHPTTLMSGEIYAGVGSSFWSYCVIHAEKKEICIGQYTNIQDFVMIHDGDQAPTYIGDYCSIGHRVVIRGARVGNDCQIGAGVIIMEGCEIGHHSIITQGAYLKEGTKIPPYSIVAGIPGRVVRKHKDKDANWQHAMAFFMNAQAQSKGNGHSWTAPDIRAKLSSAAHF